MRSRLTNSSIHAEMFTNSSIHAEMFTNSSIHAGVGKCAACAKLCIN
jgi:hypothetical protein